jgi:hypothetical protein
VGAGVRLTARGAIALVFVVTLVACVTGSPAIIGAAFVVACLAAVMLIRPSELLTLVVTPPLTYFVAMLVSQLVRSLGTASFLQAFGLGMFTSLSAGAPWLFAGSALVLVFAWFRGLPDNVRELREELRATRRPRDGRPARGDRAARADRPARADHPERADRPVRAERTDRAARPGRPVRGERPARRAYAEDPEPVERAPRGRRSGRGDQPRHGRTAGRGGPGVPHLRWSGQGGYAPEPEGYFEPRVYGSARDN